MTIRAHLRARRSHACSTLLFLFMAWGGCWGLWLVCAAAEWGMR